MKVWRVENNKGKGPYDFNNWLSAKHNQNLNLWPPPHTSYDFNRTIRHWEYCGFINEFQLHNWFSDSDLQRLEKSGFFIKRVEAEVTAMSKNQILFEKIKPKVKLEEINIDF